MPVVTVSIPYSGIWYADLYVPDDRMDDVGGYLNESDDLIQEVLEQGWEGERVLELMDVQVGD